MIPVGAVRTAPLTGETAFSLLRRAAARSGMTPAQVLPWWSWANHPPPHPGTGTGPHPDAEVLFDRAGQQVLARLCGVPEQHLARALPSWPHAAALFGQETDAAGPRARWELASRVAGPVALACRRCATRRTGREGHVLRYLPLWRRVRTTWPDSLRLAWRADRPRTGIASRGVQAHASVPGPAATSRPAPGPKNADLAPHTPSTQPDDDARRRGVAQSALEDSRC